MPTPNFALPLALCLLPACFPAKLIGEDLFADTGTDGVGPGDSTSSDSTSSDSSSSDSTTHDCGPDNSGVYLLALETAPAPDTPLQFVLTLDVLYGGDCTIATANATLQSLSLTVGSQTDPREWVGEPLIFESVEFDAMGNFVLDMGEVMITGAANPITGSDISATLVLDGHVVHVDALCGTVSGMLTSPLEFDLAGSTFAAIRLADDGTNPDTLPTTFPYRCDQVPPP